MEGSKGYFAKWNKTEKYNYSDFTYMWNIKNKTERITDTENKPVVARGEGVGGLGVRQNQWRGLRSKDF